MSKRLLIGVIAVALIALVLLQSRLPYGTKHFEQIAAIKLRGHLSAWKSSSAYPDNIESLVQSGERTDIRVFRTNFIYAGHAYNSILRLDSKNFRGDGYLLGTTNAEVFWVSKSGSLRLMEPRTGG